MISHIELLVYKISCSLALATDNWYIWLPAGPINRTMVMDHKLESNLPFELLCTSRQEISIQNIFRKKAPGTFAKSFTQSIISSIYPPSNRSKKSPHSASSDFRDSFILSISAKELVQNVLDGKSEIILGKLLKIYRCWC